MNYQTLISIGNSWYCAVISKNKDSLEDRRICRNNINAFLESNSKVRFRAALSPFNNDVLIKDGNKAKTYSYYMKRFQGDNNVTQWIYRFLNNEIDIDFKNGLDSELHADAQSFVAIVSISERARLYRDSCVQDLKDFLLGILNGKYEWKDLKKHFVPALTYKEDTDYIDVLE